jgi:Na+-driven multidrug efflux pump
MGVIGAGAAKVFSQFISAITCMIYAYRTNTYFRLKWNNFKIQPELIRKAARLGVPVALQNALIAVSLIALQRIVNSYGKTFTSAFTVVSRIEQLVQQPFMSLGAAMSTYTGQNIGAGKLKRVLRGFKANSLISSTFAICVMILFWIFAPYIVLIFGDDPQVRSIAVDGLRITSSFYIFLGMIYTTRNVLNGAGDAMFSLLSGFVECIGRVVVAYPLTLIPFMGKYGVFYATGITWFLNGMFSFVRYKRGKWKKMNVVNKVIDSKPMAENTGE